MRDLSADLKVSDPRVSCVAGDLTDRRTLDRLFDPDGCTRVTVIQLAALLSGYAEANFELGMKVNLHGAIGVMDALRAVGDKLGGPQIYLFTSTDYVAAYNEANKAAPVSEESFRLSPVSYGVQKACVELLLCDYSRKGYIDGRVGRRSAVLGRPGWSTSISWSYKGIFTQPLIGKTLRCRASCRWTGRSRARASRTTSPLCSTSRRRCAAPTSGATASSRSPRSRTRCRKSGRPARRWRRRRGSPPTRSAR